MKFHKFMSKSIIATALLGVTFGVSFGINANADQPSSSSPSSMNSEAAQVNGSDGTPGQTDTSKITKGSGNNGLRSSKIGANIRDGFLTLDSVPNLGFGNNSSTDQNTTLQLNNNNNGTIQVTDNRNVDKSSNPNNSGWKLDASIDSFQRDGTPVTSPDTWTMSLKNTNIQNDTESDSSKKPVMTNNDLTATNNNGSTGNIINATNGRAGYGTNTISYNNPNDASLDIPNVKNGSYTTSIHWNLNTTLDSYNTDYK